jgi:hypothetical protein
VKLPPGPAGDAAEAAARTRAAAPATASSVDWALPVAVLAVAALLAAAWWRRAR